MPLDPYFHSEPVKIVMSDRLKYRWVGLQRLSHVLQAEVIDELYRQAKDTPLSEEDFGLIKLWEERRNVA